MPVALSIIVGAELAGRWITKSASERNERSKDPRRRERTQQMTSPGRVSRGLSWVSSVEIVVVLALLVLFALALVVEDRADVRSEAVWAIVAAVEAGLGAGTVGDVEAASGPNTESFVLVGDWAAEVGAEVENRFKRG